VKLLFVSDSWLASPNCRREGDEMVDATRRDAREWARAALVALDAGPALAHAQTLADRLGAAGHVFDLSESRRLLGSSSTRGASTTPWSAPAPGDDVAAAAAWAALRTRRYISGELRRLRRMLQGVAGVADGGALRGQDRQRLWYANGKDDLGVPLHNPYSGDLRRINVNIADEAGLAWRLPGLQGGAGGAVDTAIAAHVVATRTRLPARRFSSRKAFARAVLAAREDVLGEGASDDGAEEVESMPFVSLGHVDGLSPALVDLKSEEECAISYFADTQISNGVTTASLLRRWRDRDDDWLQCHRVTATSNE